MHTETTNAHDDAAVDIDDHVAEARHRAQTMLGGEAHLGDVDDWRRTLVSGRDSVILVWVCWVTFLGFSLPEETGAFLVILSIAIAMLMGISTGRSTYTQAQYYASELERERSEIRDNFAHECEEIRVLYQAKGFREPLLSQIVETLSADDDRLLKVMMEEELGLHMYHMNHPLAVGAWNFLASLACGLALAVPAYWLPTSAMQVWVPTGAAFLMMLLSIVSARATRRSAIEFFSVGMVTALVIGGVAFFLAQWFSGSSYSAGAS